MSRHVDYFFDFLSPFSYLAHHRLPQLADTYGYALNYKPIDLQAAKIAAGNTGPSARDIPPKARYGVTDIKRWAERLDVPFVLPQSFRSEQLNKGTFFAMDRGAATAYVQKAGNAIFGLGQDIGDETVIRGIAEAMGWSADEFLAFIRSDAAAELYAATTRDAIDRGVFGVPTFIINGEMWWGNDRLMFVEDYLRAHQN